LHIAAIYDILSGFKLIAIMRKLITYTILITFTINTLAIDIAWALEGSALSVVRNAEDTATAQSIIKHFLPKPNDPAVLALATSPSTNIIPNPTPEVKITGITETAELRTSGIEEDPIDSIKKKANRLLNILKNPYFRDNVDNSGLNEDSLKRFNSMLDQLREVLTRYLQEGHALEGKTRFLKDNAWEIFRDMRTHFVVQGLNFPGSFVSFGFYPTFIEFLNSLNAVKDLEEDNDPNGDIRFSPMTDLPILPSIPTQAPPRT